MSCCRHGLRLRLRPWHPTKVDFDGRTVRAAPSSGPVLNPHRTTFSLEGRRRCGIGVVVLVGVEFVEAAERSQFVGGFLGGKSLVLTDAMGQFTPFSQLALHSAAVVA